VLELIALDPRQVQNRSIINASYCGSSPALKQVADLTEDIASLELAHIVFPASEICACHPTNSLGKEIERCGGPTLTNYNVFWQLLQRLTHCSDKLELALQNWVRLYQLAEKFTFLAQDSE
jgi:hypothetical protein